MAIIEKHILRLEVDIAAYIALPRRNGKYPTIIICHGIPAGPRTPGDRGYVEIVENLSIRGYASIFFNFRGVGESGGKFNYSLWLNDLKGIVDFTYSQNFTDTSKLCIVGFSGGAIIALNHAVHDGRIKALILGACPAIINNTLFRSIFEHARKHGTLRGIENMDMNSLIEKLREMEPIKWIDKISPRPLLIIHGGKDELIPVKHAITLFRKAGEPKKLKIIPNATHKLRIHHETINIIDSWLKQIWSV
ncbi:MAG: alpha/beta hydrolase [Candidatus Methanomethylicia archaeon]